jgi:ketosteroid isomerase-like protein
MPEEFTPPRRMSEENVESLRRGFELWNVASSHPDEKTWRAALDEMVAAYHPHATIDFSRTLPDFPTTDVREAMTGWIESARDTFADVHLEQTGLIEAGDSVVAGMRVTGRGSMSGVTVDAEIFYVFAFHDGKVASATTYLTRREALAAVGLAE